MGFNSNFTFTDSQSQGEAHENCWERGRLLHSTGPCAELLLSLCCITFEDRCVTPSTVRYQPVRYQPPQPYRKERMLVRALNLPEELVGAGALREPAALG